MAESGGGLPQSLFIFVLCCAVVAITAVVFFFIYYCYLNERACFRPTAAPGRSDSGGSLRRTVSGGGNTEMHERFLGAEMRERSAGPPPGERQSRDFVLGGHRRSRSNLGLDYEELPPAAAYYAANARTEFLVLPAMQEPPFDVRAEGGGSSHGEHGDEAHTPEAQTSIASGSVNSRVRQLYTWLREVQDAHDEVRRQGLSLDAPINIVFDSDTEDSSTGGTTGASRARARLAHRYSRTSNSSNSTQPSTTVASPRMSLQAQQHQQHSADHSGSGLAMQQSGGSHGLHPTPPPQLPQTLRDSGHDTGGTDDDDGDDDRHGDDEGGGRMYPSNGPPPLHTQHRRYHDADAEGKARDRPAVVHVGTPRRGGQHHPESFRLGASPRGIIDDSTSESSG